MRVVSLRFVSFLSILLNSFASASGMAPTTTSLYRRAASRSWSSVSEMDSLSIRSAASRSPSASALCGWWMEMWVQEEGLEFKWGNC